MSSDTNNAFLLQRIRVCLSRYFEEGCRIEELAEEKVEELESLLGVREELFQRYLKLDREAKKIGLNYSGISDLRLLWDRIQENNRIVESRIKTAAGVIAKQIGKTTSFQNGISRYKSIAGDPNFIKYS